MASNHGLGDVLHQLLLAFQDQGDLTRRLVAVLLMHARVPSDLLSLFNGKADLTQAAVSAAALVHGHLETLVTLGDPHPATRPLRLLLPPFCDAGLLPALSRL